ncbi:MAG: ImmA/IrrE family metallo-endopeptidase [Gammaproteobacteria bacterium]|nr:ImmA/IrrE family metallo-endopeptidase [Gammaproteobacteria bacterium]
MTKNNYGMPVRDPYLAALRFEPGQLSRARELRGLTKTALAKLIGKTPSAVTQFENGLIRPDAETVARIALALSMPTGFLARKPLTPQIRLEDCHFRSLRSVSQYLRRQALRTGEIVHEMSLLLEQEGIEFPAEQVSSLKQQPENSEAIEQLALAVRRSWGLGLGPIPRLMPLLESKGIRILPLADACKDVDAFSMWHQNTPFMMLGMQKSSSRAHFDAAHELGHLVMHEDAVPADPAAENQANRFASAFLLPRESFLPESPRRWGLPIFRALKKRWHVSIRAMVYRTHALGCLSSASYRHAYVELNRLYGHKHEPDEWTLERPQMIRQALRLIQDDFPIERLAERLALHHSRLREMLAPVMNDFGPPT